MIFQARPLTFLYESAGVLRLEASSLADAKKQLRMKGFPSSDFEITEITDEQILLRQELEREERAESYRERQKEYAIQVEEGRLYRMLTNDSIGDPTPETQYEYKHIRLDYKGRGITQEIHILDVDGQRITGWFSGGNVPTLPAIFQIMGNAGWEMVSHMVNQDNYANGVTFHYYNFKRIKNREHKDVAHPSARHRKTLGSSLIETLGA